LQHGDPSLQMDLEGEIVGKEISWKKSWQGRHWANAKPILANNKPAVGHIKAVFNQHQLLTFQYTTHMSIHPSLTGKNHPDACILSVYNTVNTANFYRSSLLWSSLGTEPELSEVILLQGLFSYISLTKIIWDYPRMIIMMRWSH